MISKGATSVDGGRNRGFGGDGRPAAVQARTRHRSGYDPVPKSTGFVTKVTNTRSR